ncbi:uncharacterized protein LOC105703049 [Orussus abietinus]|uniref:uncharacterized protein LOC105703049 n=1 Tax=Orussus abietinus TaxID=222816 RepID=UPI0006259FE3|nr:uncharacterized protein LOC105703049 [Orussus abietinus]
MIEPTIKALSGGRIVLASGSSGRREIMRNLGVNVEIVPSLFDENLDRNNYKGHGEYVQDLAYHKVLYVFNDLKNDSVPPSLIIGADTLVTMGDIIYGKPKDSTDAFRMLSSLANKEHIVFTGVCLKTPTTEIKFFNSSKVRLGDVSEEQISAYVKTCEPLNKAGGYGIQGIGGCLVEKIEGDYFTIVGIPVYLLIKHLNKLYGSL